MRTEASTRQTKAITYDMLKHAFEVLQLRGSRASFAFGNQLSASRLTRGLVADG